MLKLDLRQEPYWLDLMPGVRLKVQPARSDIIEDAILADGAATDEGGSRRLGVEFAARVAADVAMDWDGVGDGKGAPLDCTPDTVRALMRQSYACATAFRRLYIAPALGIVDEGNGSAASPSGTSEAAANTAAPAKGGATTARRTNTVRKAPKRAASGRS